MRDGMRTLGRESSGVGAGQRDAESFVGRSSRGGADGDWRRGRGRGVGVMRLEQLSNEADVPLDPDDPHSPRLPCMAIALGRTKTTQSDEGARVLLIGSAVAAGVLLAMFGK